jgi:hypothetical protein
MTGLLSRDNLPDKKNHHVKRIMGDFNPPRDTPDGWPGHDFDMDGDAGKVLLGSPVGRWAGCFLMQHKRQLGGSKFISKVRLFRSEKAGSLPCFRFYVDGPVEVGGGSGDGGAWGRVEGRATCAG